jgi:2-polyprenyl-3-methyl-5-hydroxy-6-metoxy-1,4-benzoquinol methylase
VQVLSQDRTMPLPNRVSQRRLQPEIIDQPDLEPERLFAALRGLERINWWSGSARILWPPLRELARQTAPEPLQVLDLAAGAGDVPIRLWQKAQRAGLTLQVAGCDRNPQSVQFARRRAEDQRVPVRFFEWDVLQGPLPEAADVVTCSLFLHHLHPEEAAALLRHMAAAARRLVLVNDLVRSRLGHALAWAGTRLLSASSVVHSDGPRSVEGAFTTVEASRLAEEAELRGAKIERRWPCRYLLSWQKSVPNRLDSFRNIHGQAL